MEQLHHIHQDAISCTALHLCGALSLHASLHVIRCSRRSLHHVPWDVLVMSCGVRKEWRVQLGGLPGHALMKEHPGAQGVEQLDLPAAGSRSPATGSQGGSVRALQVSAFSIQVRLHHLQRLHPHMQPQLSGLAGRPTYPLAWLAVFIHAMAMCHACLQAPSSHRQGRLHCGIMLRKKAQESGSASCTAAQRGQQWQSVGFDRTDFVWGSR